MKLFELSRDRFEVVHADISDGSEPALRFYILVAVSTLIASFLSILVVAAVTFVLSGMAKRFGVRETGTTLFKRFQLPIVAFVLIAAFLGHSLFQIAQERKMA